MDVEKILYLVAIAVYGIFSTVLSIVRTLKTSKISSEVKSVLPSIDDKKPIDDGKTIDDGNPIDDKKPIDDGQLHDDVQDVKELSIDDVMSVISEFLNRRR